MILTIGKKVGGREGRYEGGNKGTGIKSIIIIIQIVCTRVVWVAMPVRV